MTDQFFTAEADNADTGDTGFDDAAESARYKEAERRIAGDEGEQQTEEPEKDWKAEAEKADKRFQDQQKRAKAEKREKQDLQKRLDDLESRLNDKGDGKKPLTIRDHNEDPIGAIEDVRGVIESFQRQQDEEEQTAAERNKTQQREQGLAQTLQTSEANLRTLKPDYDKAVEHFKRARVQELLDMGIDQDDVPGALRREFLELIERADKTDKDPAEIVYTLAMRRGYSLDAAKQKMQTIAEGQKAGKSLSSAGGRSGDASEMTYARASQLKGPALMKAFAQIREQEKRAARR